jgi:hypothetical protein
MIQFAAFWCGSTRLNSFKDTFTIDLSDALQEAFGNKKPLFLDMYSSVDVADMLELLQVTSLLKKQGFKDLVILITPREEGDFVDRCTVTDKSLLSPEDLAKIEERQAKGKEATALDVNVSEKAFLMDLFMRSRPGYMPHDSVAYQQLNRLEDGDWLFLLKDKGNPMTCAVALANGMLSPTDAKQIKAYMDAKLSNFNLLQVDWVALQNPTETFKDRIQLPGQRYPGLHVAKQVNTCFQLLASKNGRDGVLNVPEYFHNAYMYNLSGYRFLNPAFQGWFEACLSDLSDDIATKGLGAVAWAWSQGCVYDPELGNRTILWFPQEQVYPTTPRMYDYFGLEHVDKDPLEGSTASTVFDHSTLRDPNSKYTAIKNHFKQLYRGHFQISWNQDSLRRFSPIPDDVTVDFRAFPPRTPLSIA